MADAKVEARLKALEKRLNEADEHFKRVEDESDALASRLASETAARDEQVRKAAQQERAARDEAVTSALGGFRGKVDDDLAEGFAELQADLEARLSKVFEVGRDAFR